MRPRRFLSRSETTPCQSFLKSAERATTADVSENGCRLRLKAQPERGTAVAVRMVSERSAPAAEQRALLYGVDWVKRESERYLVGTSKLQAGNLWPMVFPGTTQTLASAEPQ